MKKIVYCSIPMKSEKDIHPQNYAGKGNANCNYDKKVIFPINAVLAEKLKKGDDVKVVLIKSKAQNPDKNKWSAENVERYKTELDTINNSIGAKIVYDIIDSDFVETKENHETRYRELLGKIEPDSYIYVDMTYGPRLIPMILMCVLNFAEKFFNADIKNIIYGKVEYDEHNIPAYPALYDVTSLYYLNNLTNVMTADSGEDALEALDEFFAL